MALIGNNTILVVGGKILTTDDFVFKARQESIDDVIDNYGPPIINLIVPSSLKEGERIQIIMSGDRIYKPLRAQITGKGVEVKNVQIDNDGQLTLTCDVDEEALSELTTLDGSDLRDVVITTMGNADGSDVTDADGNVLTATTHLEDAFRVYFAEPSLSDNNLPNLEQGATYTVNISGKKFYDKWDGSRAMTSTIDTDMDSVSTTVSSRDAATITFTVPADKGRGNYDMSVSTYSGNSNTQADALKVFYSAPSATRLFTKPGTAVDPASKTNPHVIDSDASNMEIEAGESFDLRLVGSRLEDIAANAAQMHFVDKEGNPYQSIAISNVTENTPAGNGTGHHADLRVTAAADAQEVQGLTLKFQTLSATGVHSGEFACDLSVVPADPIISTFVITGREGAIVGDNRCVEKGDGPLSCQITGKNIREVQQGDLSIKVMAQDEATGALTDETSKFVIGDYTLVDQAGDKDDTLTFNISASSEASASQDEGLHYFFKLETASGSTANAPTQNVNELIVLDPNPQLSADASHNHATLRKSGENGTTTFNATITGNNFYGSKTDYATSKAQWEAAAGASRGSIDEGFAWVELSDMSGVAYADAQVMNSSQISLVVQLHNASANVGLRDVTIYTRSGSVSLEKVLDVLPPAPTVSSVSPQEQEEGTSQSLTVSGAYFFGNGAIGALGTDAVPSASANEEEEGGEGEIFEAPPTPQSAEEFNAYLSDALQLVGDATTDMGAGAGDEEAAAYAIQFANWILGLGQGESMMEIALQGATQNLINIMMGPGPAPEGWEAEIQNAMNIAEEGLTNQDIAMLEKAHAALSKYIAKGQEDGEDQKTIDEAVKLRDQVQDALENLGGGQQA